MIALNLTASGMEQNLIKKVSEVESVANQTVSNLSDLQLKVNNVASDLNTVKSQIQTHVVLTQEEYDELLRTDQVKDDVFYYIEEQ